MERPFPAAQTGHGTVIQPRRFEFEELESVPQYWFADNPIATHIENAFSILIPPGERFFIRAVKAYEDEIDDPQLKDQVRAFVQQEGLHMRAHNQLNASFASFGVDVAREVDYAERVFAWVERRVPKRIQLGMTAFLEHLTATGAHMLFMEPLVAKSMHPQMLSFWRWHAVEELEHKAVAFDVMRNVGIGYFTRAFSAVVALVMLALPFDRIARRMVKEDPHRVTKEELAAARRLEAKLMRPQVRLILDYFRPSFHPTDFDDSAYLEEWYATVAEAA